MSTANRPPRVLAIAGSDPSGGAGIHADLKSIAAFQGYGMAAITTLTAQNTHGVTAVHAPPADFLTAQLTALDADITIDAVKIGMLHSVDIIMAVEAWLARVAPPVVVLDPVMVATSGDRLLDASAEDALVRLAQRAHLVTPNLDELAVMVREPVATTWSTAREQGRRLAELLDTTILVKGGHLVGAAAPDAIVTPHAVIDVPGQRVTTRNTHGTGCSLSSAIATLRASGLSWPDALAEVKAWMADALTASSLLQVGSGHGPIDHAHRMRSTGEWARGAWVDCASLVTRITELPFVSGLGTGSLDGDAFRRYLAQDVHYLKGYAEVLAAIAESAPVPTTRAFWLESCEAAQAEIDRLHAQVLGDADETPATVTVEYLSHLRRAVESGSYARAVSAVLPCYTLYSDLGVRWRAVSRDNHPYASWLDLYGEAAFVRTAAQAERLASVAADSVDRAERLLMSAAYRTSMHFEWRFFAETPLMPA